MMLDPTAGGYVKCAQELGGERMRKNPDDPRVYAWALGTCLAVIAALVVLARCGVPT